MEVHYSSEKMDWGTPDSLFEVLNTFFNFDIDVAASKYNSKCDVYFTKDDDALTKEWQGNVWCNPPYGRELKLWLKKGYEEHLRDTGRVIVFLIPARTDTSYWHDYIFGKAHIDFLRGRVKFIGSSGEALNSAPFPSAVVVYGERSNIRRMRGWQK